MKQKIKNTFICENKTKFTSDFTHIIKLCNIHILIVGRYLGHKTKFRQKNSRYKVQKEEHQ